MALFDVNTPQSAFSRKMLYGGGNPFINKYGKLTGFGSVFSTVLPAIAGVTGSVLSGVTGIPGLGEAGSELGKGLVSTTLNDAAGGREAFTDSQEAAQQAAAKGVGLSAVGSAVGGLAGNFTSGLGKKPVKTGLTTTTSPVTTPAMSVPNVLPPLPAQTGSSSSLLGNLKNQSMGQTLDMTPDENGMFSVFGTGAKPKRSNLFAFHSGGMSGVIDEPTDYTLYDKKDKTSEDILMFTKSGKPYGAMRYGEYIVPQHETLAAGHIMDQDAPDEKKKLALGSILFSQLKKKPVTGLTLAFADGGPSIPKKSAPYRTWWQRSADNVNASLEANRRAQLPFLQKQLSQTSNPVAKARLVAMIGELEANPAPAPALSPQATESTRSAMYKKASGMGVAPSDVTVANWFKPETTAVVTAPTQPANSPTGTTATTKRKSATGVTTASKPAPTTGLTASQFSRLNQNSSLFLPNPNGDPQVSTASPVLPPKAGINPDAARVAFGMNPVGSATTFEPAVTDSAAPASKFNYAGIATGIGDVARLATGVALGSQKVDMPTIPARWMAYDSEVAQRKNMGLTPEEMALGKNSIAGNYAQGVNSLGLLTGGGSAPGVTLSGLTNLGLQRGQQTQNLLAQNAVRANQNFAQYGAVTGQTAAMESAIQNENIARQAARQQIGTGLVGATLQNIQDRSIFNQNAPLYQSLMQSQIDQANQATDTMKAIKKRYATQPA